MEIFLVGGAVRDFLLAKMHGNLPTPETEKQFWATIEKDWVVVGATSSEMLAMGYRQVGKSFPVFLHPTTQEEYALARTEKKTGTGYTGFECYAKPDVTLEEDLLRRDLTINAIAMRFNSEDSSQYSIIDPYKGVIDLEKKLFRHVSEAFAEDPVRILRIARLACRFSDFKVTNDTQDLMHKMTLSGEVDALVPDRVWQEWSRSLKEQAPWRFLEVLAACGASQKLFPEIQNITGIKNLLLPAVASNAKPTICFALVVSDLTERQLLDLVQRYRIPNEYRDLALMVVKFHSDFHRVGELSAIEILNLFEQCDAFRRPERFDDFLLTAQLLNPQNQVQSLFKALWQEMVSIDNQALIDQGFQGQAFSAEVRRIRLERINRWKKLNQ